jgi:RNA polymerase sigma-70 factor (ECF subfamily)
MTSASGDGTGMADMSIPGTTGELPASVAPCTVAQQEARLLDRIAAGDVAAFEALYRAYHPRLARFLRGMLRQPFLVEEVLDDTMLVVWRKACTFNATSKVSTWLFAIAYRQALKALRDADRAIALDEVDAIESPLPGPEVALQQLHLHARMGDALEALPPMHRIVIELAYYNGQSCREIAEVVACPVATVKTRMFHARRKLRDLLAGDIGEQAQ